jgi:hypothetical protein
MKVTVEIDLTPEEAKKLFVPETKTTEFTTMLYDAWADAFKEMNQNLFQIKEEKK